MMFPTVRAQTHERDGDDHSMSCHWAQPKSFIYSHTQISATWTKAVPPLLTTVVGLLAPLGISASLQQHALASVFPTMAYPPAMVCMLQGHRYAQGSTPEACLKHTRDWGSAARRDTPQHPPWCISEVKVWLKEWGVPGNIPALTRYSHSVNHTFLN